MKKTILLFSLVIVCSVFTMCKKDPGPKGDTGATGPQGAKGNANVMTFTTSTTASSWVLNGPYWRYDYTAPVSDKDIVLCYFYNGLCN